MNTPRQINSLTGNLGRLSESLHPQYNRVIWHIIFGRGLHGQLRLKICCFSVLHQHLGRGKGRRWTTGKLIMRPAQLVKAHHPRNVPD